MPRHALRRLARAIAFLLALPGPAFAADTYALVHLRSVHPAGSALTDRTPGLGLGIAHPLTARGAEWFAEAAIFSNSYGELGPLVTGGLSIPLARTGPVELRAGAALGIGRYAALCDRLRKRYPDMPETHDLLPLAALSLAARTGRAELRLSAIPHNGMPAKRPILNLGLAWRF